MSRKKEQRCVALPAGAEPRTRRTTNVERQWVSRRVSEASSLCPLANRSARTIDDSGGRGGIRTHGTVTRTPDFESGAFDQLSHPSTAHLNQGREDSANRRLVDEFSYCWPSMRSCSLGISGRGGKREDGLSGRGKAGLSLIDLFFLRIPLFLTQVLVVIGELIHGSADEAHQRRAHGVEPL
jgi:hypothetical protein